ncbi:MAG: NTPase [Alphaproteobacteria bacterium]|nr:NTPase [Alphaproteobacteria bacterium]
MLTNDTPITKPDDDRFGIDPFSHALARAVAEMPAPEGVVIGINGPWGCGKSSALNLILYHLNQAISDGKIKVVQFSPWWLSGTDAIAATFLDDLLTAIGPSLGDAAKMAFQGMAKKLLRFRKAAALAANLAVPGVGTAIDGAAQAVEGLLPGDPSLESQHQKVSALLKDSDCRYLVIIDDIDRLAPDEALEVFKLVKSVGQLSNLIYILAFDRELAERLITERFPSEGPHYLEKILQAAFEVPAVSPADIREAFLAEVNHVSAPRTGEDVVRFMNIMLEVVTPFLKSPRDLKRLIGMVQVTWPAVASEVDRADFLAIEALRLFTPDLYRAIRDNSERLTGGAPRLTSRSDQAAEYDVLLLGNIRDHDKPRIRRALQRLFPRLESVWANVHYNSETRWRRQRLICSADHFPTYFRLSVDESILSARSISEIVEKAGDQEYVQKTLRHASKEILKSGKTRASMYLDELLVHASDIAEADIQPLVSALFEVADELDVESDQGKGFDLVNNRLRLHWILNSLVRERLPQSARIPLFEAAMEGAPLHWFCDFAERCNRDHTDKKEVTPEDQRFVDAKTANAFVRDALKRLRRAADDGSLLSQNKPLSLLWEWARLSSEGEEEVRPRLEELLKDDKQLMLFVRDAVQMVWSQGMGMFGLGDLVSKGTPQVKKEAIIPLLDEKVFLARVRDVAQRTTDAADKEFLNSFQKTWAEQKDSPLAK